MNPDPNQSRSCRRVRGRIGEHLEGGLAPLEEAQDRGHLETCTECVAELERLRDLERRLGELGPSVDDLRAAQAGLEARLAAARAPRRRRAVKAYVSSLVLPAAAAAAGFLALVGLQASGALRAPVPQIFETPGRMSRTWTPPEATWPLRWSISGVLGGSDDSGGGE